MKLINQLRFTILMGASAFSFLLSPTTFAQPANNQSPQDLPQKDNTDPPQVYYQTKLYWEPNGNVMECKEKWEITSKNSSVKSVCTLYATGYTIESFQSLLIKLGNNLKSQGNIAGAEKAFREIIQDYPSNANAHYNLGLILSQQGKKMEAISHYRQAIKIDPNYAKAHNELAVEIYLQGNRAEAIAEWREAIKINSDYADALYYLGVALLQENSQNNEAISKLKKAQDLFIRQNQMSKAKEIQKILQQIGVQ